MKFVLLLNLLFLQLFVLCLLNLLLFLFYLLPSLNLLLLFQSLKQPLKPLLFPSLNMSKLPQATSSVTDALSTYQLKWNRIENLQPIPPYSGPAVGPTFHDIHSTPLSIFDKIFDGEVWQFMVHHTHNYANWIRAQEPAKHKCSWNDVTVEEL